MKIIVLGSQGSGKSTQAKMLAHKLGLPYIEMGQIFRNKAQENSSEAEVVRRALKIGNLVPDQIAIKTLHDRLSRDDCRQGFILDGYPRNYAQLEGLPENIDKVISIQVSDTIAIERLILRARGDDNLEIITHRLNIYHKETEPLLVYFKEKKILEEIDGTGSIAEIHQEILERIQN